MLNLETTALVVIDVQGKLSQLMHNSEEFNARMRRMAHAAQTLDLPILWVEQVPHKLGHTTPELGEILAKTSQPIAKHTFSACGNEEFMSQLTSLGRKQLLITGIEAHICVYQTTVDLLAQGYEAQVVTDAVSSRFVENHQLGLSRMRDAGAVLTSSEMALFEMLKQADGSDRFRAITRLVK